MLMRTHDGTVHKDVFKVWVVTHGSEKTLENAIPTPTIEADIDAVPLAELSGQCPPMCSGSSQPKDSFHEQTVIPTGSAGITCLAGQMWLHQRPHAVIEFPIFQSCWPPYPVTSLNHKLSGLGILNVNTT